MDVLRGDAREDLGSPWLWLALLTPPVAWLVHVGGMYALVPASCRHQTNLALHLFTLATALPILLSWWVGHRVRREHGTRDDPVGRRIGFLAQLVLISSPLFLAVTLAEWLPVLVVHDPCQ